MGDSIWVLMAMNSSQLWAKAEQVASAIPMPTMCLVDRASLWKVSVSAHYDDVT